MLQGVIHDLGKETFISSQAVCWLTMPYYISTRAVEADAEGGRGTYVECDNSQCVNCYLRSCSYSVQERHITAHEAVQERHIAAHEAVQERHIAAHEAG